MSRLLLHVLFAAFFVAPLVLSAQTPKQAAEQWRAAHEQQILQEFTALLSIPNVASDTTNILRNAKVLARGAGTAARQCKIADCRRLQPCGVWRNQDAWRQTHHRFLCTLRWTSSKSRGLGERSTLHSDDEDGERRAAHTRALHRTTRPRSWHSSRRSTPCRRRRSRSSRIFGLCGRAKRKPVPPI